MLQQIKNKNLGDRKCDGCGGGPLRLECKGCEFYICASCYTLVKTKKYSVLKQKKEVEGKLCFAFCCCNVFSFVRNVNFPFGFVNFLLRVIHIFTGAVEHVKYWNWTLYCTVMGEKKLDIWFHLELLNKKSSGAHLFRY